MTAARPAGSGKYEVDLLLEIVSRIEAERSQFAHSVLSQPGGHESFDYGRACGMYAGLSMAVDIINAVVEDRDDEERRK